MHLILVSLKVFCFYQQHNVSQWVPRFSTKLSKRKMISWCLGHKIDQSPEAKFLNQPGSWSQEDWLRYQVLFTCTCLFPWQQQLPVLFGLAIHCCTPLWNSTQVSIHFSEQLWDPYLHLSGVTQRWEVWWV